MAHQTGWIELYEFLEQGREPSSELVATCKSSRTSVGETMLHWYAIEGEPAVLQALIDLGFDVNVQNEFGKTPMMESSMIGRWDNARVLLDNGADLSLRDHEGQDYFEFLEDMGVEVPDWVRR